MLYALLLFASAAVIAVVLLHRTRDHRVRAALLDVYAAVLLLVGAFTAWRWSA